MKKTKPKSTKRVIIFNGPPSSGKDTACWYIKNCFSNIVHMEVKKRLIDITRVIYNVSISDWDSRYNEYTKNVPWNKLDGLSQREALIKVSEHLIKPVYGSDYFGKALIEDIRDIPEGTTIVFSDGGFIEEVKSIADEVGADNVLIVRIYRENCSFDNDSRSYLFPDFCQNTSITNTSIADFYRKLDYLMDSINKNIKVFGDSIG